MGAAPKFPERLSLSVSLRWRKLSGVAAALSHLIGNTAQQRRREGAVRLSGSTRPRCRLLKGPALDPRFLRVSRHRYRDILSPDAFDLDQSGGMRLDIG